MSNNYRMKPKQSDGSIIQVLTPAGSVVSEISSGGGEGGGGNFYELADVAALSLAADRLVYFTGVSTIALATFTTAGRNLVDDADAEAQRTTLGLGTAATQNTGTSGANVPLLNGANTFSSGQTFLAATGASPQTAITIDNANITGSDRQAVLNVTNPNGSSGGMRIAVAGTEIVRFQYNGMYLATGMPFGTAGGSTTWGNYYMRRGSTQEIALGTTGGSDLFRLDGRSATSHQLIAHMRSSTTDSQAVWSDNSVWIDNTHASRKASRTGSIYDTAARTVYYAWTDGSSGYFAVSAPNGTAPDSNQPNNTVCFYRDGSNNLQVRYKNNSGTTTDINLGAVT